MDQREINQSSSNSKENKEDSAIENISEIETNAFNPNS